jgi:DNA-binding transcriptional LysR family regulator
MTIKSFFSCKKSKGTKKMQKMSEPVKNILSEQIRKISLESLRYYVVLAEMGSFSDAAKQLHITQQALSKAISAIEDQFGLRLIDRKKQFNGLTQAGTLFLEKAKVILHNLYDLDKFFTEFKSDTPNGSIIIAWASLWGKYVLPKVIKNLLEEFPGIFPILHYLPPDEIEKIVSTGEIEVGLLGTPPQRKDLDFLVGPTFPYVIAGKPQPFKQWDELNYIVPKNWKEASLNNTFSAWDDEKYKRKVVMEADSLSTCISLCEEGLGAIFVPESAVQEMLRNGSLAIIAKPPFEFSTILYLVWKKNFHLSATTRAFIINLRKNLPFKKITL